MRTKRPTSVLVIAIFHFIFGGFGLIGGLVGLVFGIIMFAQPKPPPGFVVASNPPTITDTSMYLDANVPFWREVSLSLAVVGLGLSIILLVSGFGLLFMKPWARTLSIGYGAGSIVLQCCSLFYTIVYLTPAQIALYDQMPPPAGMTAAQAQSIASLSKTAVSAGQFAGLLGLIYPVIVLIIMSRPKVRATFRGESIDADRNDDFDNDRTDRRREDEYDDESRGRGEPDDRFGPAR
jgi:hypothetical protein